MRNRRMLIKNFFKLKSIYLVILLLIIGTVLIKVDYSNSQEKLYDYEINRDSNYQVLLKENTFYNEKILKNKNYYLSNLIEKSNLEFSYKVKVKKKSDIFYNYNVTAELLAMVQDDKEIWHQKFVLVPDKTNRVKTNDLVITNKTEINYNYFSNLVKDYELTYGIKVNAILKIKFNITYGPNNTSTLKDNIQVNIGLGDIVSDVENVYKKNDIKTINLANQQLNVSFITVAGYIFILIALSIIIIKFKKFYLKTLTRSNKNIKEILKEYNNIVVRVKNKPDTENLKILQIVAIEDLINVAEQNNSHIIHYENKVTKEENLYVIVNNYMYLYIIKA